MPFCLSCRSEYRDGVDVCPECGAPLAAGLPDEPPVDVDLVEVFSGPFFQAALLRGLLEEKGLVSVVYEGIPYPCMLGNAAQPLYQKVLISRADLESNREAVDECLELVGPSGGPPREEAG